MFSPTKHKEIQALPSLGVESDLRAKQDLELDALRQRGLAKILNKHFTETTRKLAAEKAAADAALRDLERRKAQTSGFTPSSNSEISHFDALYLSVNQWRAECRRKEKETLLLYQRYVDKFASAGYVQVPGCAPLTPPRKNTSRFQVTPPTVGTAASMTPMSGVTEQPPKTPAASSTPVPNLAAAIETTLEEYLKSGAISLPSIGQLGLDSTYASEHDKQVQDFRNFYRQQLETVHGGGATESEIKPTKLATTPEEKEGESELEDEPAVAPMTAPNTFLQSIENAVEATRTVTPDKLGQDMDDDGMDCFGGPINYLQPKDDSDSDSVVSGLTINSALTRRIIDDCERTVVTFFNEEKDFIRQQLELEEHMNASSSHVGSMSEVQSVQMQAAVQAESMARQMKEILEKFERDQEQASATDTSASVMTSRKTKESRPYPTNNPNEDWVVLFDGTYNREYYHERKSGRTQWEPPMVEDDVSGDATSTTSRQSAMLSHAEVKPEVESRPMSRIELYRRKRRRQRKRRIALASLALAMSVVVGAVWVYKHPNSAVAKQFVQPIMSKFFSSEDVTAKMLEEELAREEADRLRVLEEERIAREQAEKERRLLLEREAAVLMARQEAERKAAQAAEERRLKELAAAEKAKREAELWIQQQEELRRPVACNIPFAYAFNGKCRRLASKNPVFDFQGLVESMLQ